MLDSSFVQFPPAIDIPRNPRYDGYLAFIPQQEHNFNTEQPFRFYKGKDFSWFEFQAKELTKQLEFQVNALENQLWLLINMRTGVAVKMNPIQAVDTDTILCYQTTIDKHDIQLHTGSNWLLLLGIAPDMIGGLIQEHPQLEQLLMDNSNNNTYRTIGTMTMHAKIRRVLNGLSQMQFRPFSTYFQLATWNIRFFEHVFQALKPTATKDDMDNHQIALYYRAMSYIAAHYQDDQTNTDTIAAALCVSVSTLKRAFKDRPLSVAEQIIACRLEEAKKLIRETDSPIPLIAASLNFMCPKNFKRLFIKRFTVSPMEYRKKRLVKRLF